MALTPAQEWAHWYMLHGHLYGLWFAGTSLSLCVVCTHLQVVKKRPQVCLPTPQKKEGESARSNAVPDHERKLLACELLSKRPHPTNECLTTLDHSLSSSTARHTCRTAGGLFCVFVFMLGYERFLLRWGQLQEYFIRRSNRIRKEERLFKKKYH